MLRCDNCGWSNNPDGAEKCQKCNQELVVLPSVPVTSGKDTDKSVPGVCSVCGYPLAQESSFCPNCGSPVGTSPRTADDMSMKRTVRDFPTEMRTEINGSSSDMRQTMRDVPFEVRSDASQSISPASGEQFNVASFRLRPIDVEAQEAFAFGNDADAAFEFADGQWSIVDRSGSGSVYVGASRRIALQKGDVVLIGGRKYRFE